MPSLLRSCLFTFQGIDSAHFKYSASSSSFLIAPNITGPLRDLLRRVCEVGELYLSIKAFVDGKTATSRMDRQGDIGGDGLVMQSLRASVGSILSGYWKWVAVLESQLPPINDASDEISSNTTNNMKLLTSLGSSTLTFRRLVVWMSEVVDKLRVLSALIMGVKSKRGGEILTVLWGYMSHGDLMVQEVIGHRLEDVSIKKRERGRKKSLSHHIQFLNFTILFFSLPFFFLFFAIYSKSSIYCFI